MFLYLVFGPFFAIIYHKPGLSRVLKHSVGGAGDRLALVPFRKLSKTVLQKHFQNTVGVLKHVVYIFSMRNLEVVFTY